MAGNPDSLGFTLKVHAAPPVTVALNANVPPSGGRIAVDTLKLEIVAAAADEMPGVAKTIKTDDTAPKIHVRPTTHLFRWLRQFRFIVAPHLAPTSRLEPHGIVSVGHSALSRELTHSWDCQTTLIPLGVPFKCKISALIRDLNTPASTKDKLSNRAPLAAIELEILLCGFLDRPLGQRGSTTQRILRSRRCGEARSEFRCVKMTQ